MDGAGDDKDIDSEFERVAGGDQGPAFGGRLNNKNGPGQGGNDPVSLWKVVRSSGHPIWVFGDEGPS
jgi:hypothetical protein